MADSSTPTKPSVIQAPSSSNPQSLAVDYYSPLLGGGSMLNDAAGPGKGEPLNVIISGLSSPEVLTDAGFLNFSRAIGYDRECFGFHRGTPQKANLGDGNGWVDQTVEYRQNFGIPFILGGTCWESLLGGKHFRVYRQNGPLANSGAIFLASSKEMNIARKHMIVTDGYNINRDSIAAAALGKIRYKGVTYSTRVKDITGLLEPGVKGVNHNIPQDGIVVLLTVTIVK